MPFLLASFRLMMKKVIQMPTIFPVRSCRKIVYISEIDILAKIPLLVFIGEDSNRSQHSIDNDVLRRGTRRLLRQCIGGKKAT